jgi:hypothetical protein
MTRRYGDKSIKARRLSEMKIRSNDMPIEDSKEVI